MKKLIHAAWVFLLGFVVLVGGFVAMGYVIYALEGCAVR